MYVIILIFILNSRKHDDDDDPFVSPELKGFNIITTLNLILCLHVNLNKDKLNKLNCITKKSTINMKSRHGWLSTKSEIDLKTMQSDISTSDDMIMTVMFDRESRC